MSVRAVAVIRPVNNPRYSPVPYQPVSQGQLEASRDLRIDERHGALGSTADGRSLQRFRHYSYGRLLVGTRALDPEVLRVFCLSYSSPEICSHSCRNFFRNSWNRGTDRSRSKAGSFSNSV